MSISRGEFLRLLLRAVGGASIEAEGNVFVHLEADRSWRIALRPLPDLHRGSLRLERLEVEWRFSGYEEKELEAIARRFELHFRRGGG